MIPVKLLRLEFVEDEGDGTSGEEEPHRDDVGGEAGQHVLVGQNVEDGHAFAAFEYFRFCSFHLGSGLQTLHHAI